MKKQVVKQVQAIRANPGLSGFAAAFTSPLTITGGAKLFTIYTSKEVFNGEVLIKFSTDGKFFIAGKLNFAADKISLSAKLYADLSKVAQGNVTVLFLADIPDQVRLLTIQGKLKLGFKNAGGDEVEFTTVPTTSGVVSDVKPTATLIDPVSGHIDVKVLNGRPSPSLTPFGSSSAFTAPYVDVTFAAPNGQKLDYASILDAGAEITVSAKDPGGVVRTYKTHGVPVPLETVVDASGVLTVVAVTGATQDALITAISNSGANRFRYYLTTDEGGSTFTGFQTGEVTVNVLAFDAAAGAGFKNADVTATNGSVTTGVGNLAAAIKFTADGATAAVLNPGPGGFIDLNQINRRNYIDVTFPSAADDASITDAGAEFALSGPGLGSIGFDPDRAPQLVSDVGGVKTYRYFLTGRFVTDPTLPVAARNVTLGYVTGGWTESGSPATARLSVTSSYGQPQLHRRELQRVADEFARRLEHHRHRTRSSRSKGKGRWGSP